MLGQGGFTNSVSTTRITASRPTAQVTLDRLIELEWLLNRAPGPSWVGRFLSTRFTGSRPLAWSQTRPVVVGDRIRVSAVHDDDVEMVRSWIDAAIEFANRRTVSEAPPKSPGTNHRRLRPLTA